MIDFTDYMGTHISLLLNTMPFKCWKYERSLETDLDEPIIHYVFPENGMELRCDRDEKISVIFLFSDEFGRFDDELLEVRFSSSRQQILEKFGCPSKTGGGMSIRFSVFGGYGIVITQENILFILNIGRVQEVFIKLLICGKMLFLKEC